jgi:hypothetical protein
MSHDPSPLDPRIESLDRRIEELSPHLPAPAPRHRPPPPADPLDHVHFLLKLLAAGAVWGLVVSVLALFTASGSERAEYLGLFLGSLWYLAVFRSGLRDLERARSQRQTYPPSTERDSRPVEPGR